jgi:hypothetical protein
MAERVSTLYYNIITLNQSLNKLLKFLPTNQTLDALRLPPVIPLAWQMVEGSTQPAVHLLSANEEEVTTCGKPDLRWARFYSRAIGTFDLQPANISQTAQSRLYLQYPGSVITTPSTSNRLYRPREYRGQSNASPALMTASPISLP